MRIGALVVHGTGAAWLAYLREASRSRAERERPARRGARAVIEDVIENHDNLALGLARPHATSSRDNGGPR